MELREHARRVCRRLAGRRRVRELQRRGAHGPLRGGCCVVPRARTRALGVSRDALALVRERSDYLCMMAAKRSQEFANSCGARKWLVILCRCILCNYLAAFLFRKIGGGTSEYLAIGILQSQAAVAKERAVTS